MANKNNKFINNKDKNNRNILQILFIRQKYNAGESNI